MRVTLRIEPMGETRSFPEGRHGIGRGPGNDWYIPGRGELTVSRQHCVLAVARSGTTVTDLGSSNGTFVNGHRLEPHLPTPLLPGDTLCLGKLEVTVLEDMPVHGAGIFDGDFAGLDRSPAEDAGRDIRQGPAILTSGPGAASGSVLEDFLKVLEGRQEAIGPTADSAGGGSGSYTRGAQVNSAWVGPPAARATAAEPGTPPRPGGTDAAGGLSSFLEGAGMPANALGDADPAATLREAGRTFAVMAEGLRALLAARAAVKRDADLAHTVIQASHNNPLKFCANQAEAASALLAGRGPGYMPPADAAREAVQDLMDHELGMLEGLEAAVDGLLSSLDPAGLEERLAGTDMLTLLVRGGRRAQLWDLYKERYAGLAGAARKRFLGEAAEAFREAYDREAGHRRRPAPRRRRGA